MTVVRNDLQLYEREGDDWWSSTSRAFRSLRSVKAFHLALLERWFPGRIRGLRIVDLGCGGGLLSVPLAQRGARVLGVDLSARSLACAALHAPAGRCGFVRADLTRTPFADATADLVLVSDVIEHVDDPAGALREAARLIRPGGALFVSTLNRTLRARLLAVTIAESVRLVPPGTHDPRMFVRPVELREFARDAGLTCERWQGESVALLNTVRRWSVTLKPSASLAVGYSALLRKEAR